ncbi:MAG: serine/threonine-protein kinase, partial [Planctomycetota bacterium]
MPEDLPSEPDPPSGESESRDHPETLPESDGSTPRFDGETLAIDPDVPADPHPKKTLGAYRILEEIGRGGMGVVYKAFHPDLKRTVALKALIAGEDASEEAIARFHREAEAVARLGHHPHIVPIYEIGQEGRIHFFAMLYVEGKALDLAIDDEEVGPRRAAVIAKKLAEALSYAHEHGILHRDVKPANVLMGSFEGEGGRRGEGGNLSPPPPVAPSPPRADHTTPEPMLTDFGLAKDIQTESSMTRTGTALGTPQYMPPEQAGALLDQIDARSDVYSLGATLYEMLTLRPPFEAENPYLVINKVLTQEPVPPRKINSMVDKDLETICLKCLEKEPDNRYASARSLAKDLERYLQGDAIQARPVGSLERWFRRVRRNRAMSAVLAVLFLVICAGAAIGFVGWREWEEER